MTKNPRHQAVITRQSESENNDDHWLRQFENTLLKVSVQPARKEVFDQINSIMNNSNSKYSSVQEKVDEMMARSGMQKHLSATNKENEGSKKTAQDNNDAKDPYQEGFDDGAEDKKLDQAGDIVASLCALKHVLSLHDAYQYAIGYAKGAEFDEKTEQAELNRVRKVLDMAAKKVQEKREKTAQDNATAKNELPEIIKQKPAIGKTLENIIQDTRGTMSVPTILSRLHTIHRQDVSDDNLWEDDNLVKLISSLNLQAKKDNPVSESLDNLGKSDTQSGDDFDASNSDAFAILNPAKTY